MNLRYDAKEILMEPKYKRVVLKISGEALSSNGKNIDFDVVENVARQVVDIHKLGVEACIIIGGGNIWRGRSGGKMDRTTADHMGMLATVINSLAMQDAIESLGAQARLQTAIEMKAIAEPYIRRKAERHLEKGRIVIFACGTGNPYFTTDSAAALRAAEMQAEIILMAKNVDGVYDSDPRTNPNAKRYETIPYIDVIDQHLAVMDTTAVTLCMDNNIKICAFGLATENSIMRVVCGESLGTLIC